MKTLLLWDIDGTLIDSGGAGDLALKLALEREFGIADALDWLDHFGRTDVWIARLVLERHGIPATPENIERYLERYLLALAENMNNPLGRILPGVLSIVESISRRTDIAQGLLTGNLQRGARIKLDHFSLWDFFSFGAFADDSAVREELGPHALRRAGAHHRVSFVADQVIIIGDTPRDIACGKAIGARTIAVATGRFPADELRQHTPNHVLEHLGDSSRFFACLQ